MAGTSDFQFTASLDATGLISGARSGQDAITGIGSDFNNIQREAEVFAQTLAKVLAEAGIGAAHTGDQLAGIAPHAQHAGEALKHMGEEGHSAFAHLKEQVSEVSQLIAGGALAGGAIFALHKVFEGGKEAAESMERYKTTLMQAGVAESEIGAKQKEGETIVQSLSQKYGLQHTELRTLLGTMTAISGQTGVNSQKLTEIGVAFEHVGIPARMVRQLLTATGQDGQKAFEMIAQKIPSLAGAMKDANTPAERLDAVYKGMSGTLKGMAEEMDSPAGKMKQLEVVGKDLQESVGGLLVQLAGGFLPAIKGVADVIENPVLPALQKVTNFVEENRTAVGLLIGGFAALKIAMAIQDAGGLATMLGKGAANAEQFASSILGKLIPGYAAKAAAQSEDALLAELSAKANNSELTAVERLEAEEQKLAIIKQRGAAASAEAAAQSKLDALLKGESAAATEASAAAAGQDAAAKGAETVATGGATIAQQALNLVMSANPAVLLVAGIAAVVAAFLIFSSKTKDLKVATEDANKAVEDFHTTVDKSDAISKEADTVSALADKYDQLSKIANPSAQQRAELADATDKLAKAAPGAVDQEDKLNEAGQKVGVTLKITTSQVRALTEEQKKNAAEAKTDALQKMKETALDLANSYHAAKDKVKELRDEQAKAGDAQLGSQVSHNLLDVFKSTKTVVAELGHEVVENNKKIDESEPVIRKTIAALKGQGETQQQIAKETGLTVEEVKKFDLAVQESEPGMKALVETAADLEKRFQEGTTAAQGLREQQTRAATQDVLDIQDLRKQRSEAHKAHNDELVQELDAKIKAKQTDIEAHVEEAKGAEKDIENRDKQLQNIKLRTGEEKKAGEDLVALAEAKNKKTEQGFKTELLRTDNGKLTLLDQIKLLQLQEQGLPLIIAAIQHEEGRAKSKKQLIDLQTKEFELEGQQLELHRKIADEIARQTDETYKLIAGIDRAEIALLKLFVKPSDSPLELLGKEVTIAQRDVTNLFATFGNRPDLKPALDALHEFIDESTGAFKKGIDPKTAFDSLTETLDNLVKAGNSDAAKLKDIFLTPLATLATANNAVQTQITKDTNDAEKRRTDALKQRLDQTLSLVELGATDQIEILRRQEEVESKFHEAVRAAAITAHGEQSKEVEKIDQEYEKKRLERTKQLLTALKQQEQQHAQDISKVLKPGFDSAFSVINKSLFDPLDKALNTSENIFGAFASGILKNLASMGEQALAQLIIGSIASATAAATTSAAMNTILASAIPAATAVSIASFGAADVTAGASMTALLASMEGLFKSVSFKAQGGVIGAPTLTVLGENYENEFILPEKTADTILRDKITNAQNMAGGGGANKKDMEDAFSNALQRNPTVAQVGGHHLEILRQRNNSRMSLRQ